MAAGIVYHNITTASGVTFAIAQWVPDIASADANAKALMTLFDTAGVEIVRHEDQASADGDPGFVLLAQRQAAPANTSGADGDYEALRVSGGRLFVRGEARMFSAAVTQLARPANVTAYSVGDAISNNATAGSVAALSATVSDTNDDPINITEMLLDTNDTGLAASCQIRAYLYNSDPTASSGVGGGDNAAFSNKKAGFIGTMIGTFRAFSDGGKARLFPEEGSYIIAPPGSGAKTVWVQYEARSGFAPSANSTTIDATLKGFQGRA